MHLVPNHLPIFNYPASNFQSGDPFQISFTQHIRSRDQRFLVRVAIAEGLVFFVRDLELLRTTLKSSSADPTNVALHLQYRNHLLNHRILSNSTPPPHPLPHPLGETSPYLIAFAPKKLTRPLLSKDRSSQRFDRSSPPHLRTSSPSSLTNIRPNLTRGVPFTRIQADRSLSTIALSTGHP